MSPSEQDVVDYLQSLADDGWDFYISDFRIDGVEPDSEVEIPITITFCGLPTTPSELAPRA